MFARGKGRKYHHIGEYRGYWYYNVFSILEKIISHQKLSIETISLRSIINLDFENNGKTKN
ncbi:MAG: hypothetical protein BAJALOKI2v1_810005 [Promethearchaeota archaeon]|nr:MAG: hypothetical protein BAJALOKI2v1_810005 [Candidatus Lokiarchaeota archaeon]